MQRRGLLACAIVHRPALLVCDEPAVGLDPEEQQAFRRLVREQGEHRTVLLSGGLDPVTPPAYGDEVAKGFPNSRHVIAAGFGHIVSPHACAPRLIAAFVDAGGFATLDAACVDFLSRSKRPPSWPDRLAPQP
jgi:pimeloyl-ACP methyl ester carboxylesterase